MFAKKRFNSTCLASAGLTMIEIAIVILIIGGLLAAFLSYKEVMRTVRLKQVASEVQSFGIAARSFDQKYDALPGDYDAAGDNIPGCEVNPDGTPNNPNFCRNGNGDGRVGGYCHFMSTDCGQTGLTRSPSYPEAIALETSMFWKHLFLTGFITGIIDPHANPGVPRWRESHPESSVWSTGYTVSSQGGFIGGSVNINFIPTPEYLGSAISKTGANNNLRSLTVPDAIYMDRKYDNAVYKDTPNAAERRYTGAGSGALWWNPIGNAPTDCRTSDNQGTNDAWITENTNMKNCVFIWTVF